jgi:hypothetical protein
LFFGFFGEVFYPFLNFLPNSSIQNILEHLSRLKGQFDLVRQD